MEDKSKRPSNSNLKYESINQEDYIGSIHTLGEMPGVFHDWIDQYGFDFICVCDTRGNILYASSSAKRLLGYEPDDLTGERSIDFCSPQDREKLISTFMNQNNKATTFDLQIRQKSGKYIWVETIASHVEDPNTKNDVILAITRDISDKKEAEEMMIRSEKMSVAGQLAAGIAHEIRNPLTSLKGFLQLIQAGIDGKEEYYTIMNEEIEKIETITSELLFISKPMTNDRRKESIITMLQDVCTLLRSQAKLHNIDLVLNYEENEVIDCDRSQIKQVFINLIKNAVEVMEDGGRITVDVESDEDNVWVDVADEGPGIPKHLVDKIKEPFFTTKKNGTGLGLMITNQILEKHEGGLNVYDNEPTGSVFRVQLPREVSKAN
ncbi:ATP-binding protein [Pontibacillus sp. HMF3514]|uniref:ATP-binding protein n=1 Tax=Pontibacillus sp. HMF3514 TaxID=2692425 RepID=UPI001F28FEDF|nr:ATP-binding protein [Pontibacillus sp. HMF3514]